MHTWVQCLAAGSTIANKEEESERLRPSALRLCKEIEKMRIAVRTQAIEAPHCYTAEVHVAGGSRCTPLLSRLAKSDSAYVDIWVLEPRFCGH
jgi:hypothetical protein